MYISNSDLVCNRLDPLRDPGAAGGLRIEYVISSDLADGRPSVPVDDDESFWVLVARNPDGTTGWRRIAVLQPTPNREAAP